MLRRSTADRPPRAGRRAPGERVVDVVGVGKRWPRRRWFGGPADVARDVLADLTFSIDRGEIVVVLGENGAGKTTLLKIIGGLARADEGHVRVLGYDAGAASPALRSRVAYAGGERGFYFRLTVRENLAFFSALDGLSAADRARRIVEVTRTVDIEADLDRRFADLSTGIRQRLAIARALLADPDVLLLDEPTRALDPPHATLLRRFVRDTLAGDHGKTIVVATNLIDEALELGDRIAILRSARLEFIAAQSAALAETMIYAKFGMSTDA